MEIINCIDAAEMNLYNARRFLETGEGINWVTDRLSAGLYWAMEAWVMAKGHEIEHGRGWESTRSAFRDAAPEQLRSPIMSCLAKSTFLEYDLEGGFNHEEPLPPMTVWMERAFACLEESEKAVNRLFKDINSPNRTGIE